MIEAHPQLINRWGVRSHLFPRGVEVLAVLAATAIAAEHAGEECQRASTPIVAHLPERVGELEDLVETAIPSGEAHDLGLVTFAPDDIDWDDEVRLAIDERCGLSPDALTGMEASLRFAGPETTWSKVFGRLSAWQNWIFIRPNAVGEGGALKLFGSGTRAEFDQKRV